MKLSELITILQKHQEESEGHDKRILVSCTKHPDNTKHPDKRRR
jgi:hypothetical protein